MSAHGKLDRFTFWASIAAAVLCTAAGELFLRLQISGILNTALYVAGQTAFLAGVCLLCTKLRGFPEPKSLKLLSLLLVGVIVASIPFELIYELDIIPGSGDKPTSFVFLIDDSGSMSINDPDNERCAAISKVMESQPDNFPFCIYSFEDEAIRLTDMQRAADAKTVLNDVEKQMHSDGGTDIVHAIHTVADDLNQNNPDGGKRPRIILLTDGDSDSHGLEAAIKEADKAGATICTIGFGTEFDENLETIAELGHGVFVRAENVEDLSQAYVRAAAGLNLGRNLYKYRTQPVISLLYAAERIVFLFLLFLALAEIKLLLLNVPNQLPIFPTYQDRAYFAAAAIAAVLMELGLNAVPLPGVLIRLLVNLLIFIALVPDKSIWAQFDYDSSLSGLKRSRMGNGNQ